MAERNGNNAWLVVVPEDTAMKRAIVSGISIRKSKSAARIIALVSPAVSKETINKLNTVFHMVIVSKALMEVDLDRSEQFMETFLLNALTLTTFSKIIVVQAGVLLCGGQVDYRFESVENNKLVCRDEKGNFLVALVTPEVSKFLKIINTIKLQAPKSKADLLNLIFGKHVTNQEGITASEKKIDAESSGIIVVTEKEAGNLYTNMSSIEDLNGNLSTYSLPLIEDKSKWVAIVGMSCRFPEANSVEEYWELLSNGRNTSGTPPAHRTNLVHDLDPTIKGNFLKCPIDQFDASFFGFSPTEAIFTDPQARILLEVSWEALEDAGVNPDGIRGTKVGVFYGSWLQDYKEAINENGSAPSQDFLRKYLGNGFGSTAAKLSFFYGITGPNVATESACSSSVVAIDEACKSLERKESTMALACGANLMLHLNKQNIVWAADGKSKTFDVGANGYARAEGIAVLVLKRYEDAISDNDNIHGIIRGIGTSQEGLSKSFGSPTIQSEYDSMTKALLAAKVTPTQVDYLEAHATGTSVGDPIESAAIVKAYSENTTRESPLIIGSGKTNLGHTESCSGMAGIIKVILSMKNEMIPKHVNFTKMNPQIDFTPIPGVIPLEAMPWPRKSNERPRIAGVSSFGITGTDVHLIIQEPPIQDRIKCENKNSSRSAHILTLSAKSEQALEQMTHEFLNHLEALPPNQEDIESISYTANVCRAHYPFRRAIVGSTVKELKTNIQKGNMFTCPSPPSPSKKICFTFPGRIGAMSLEPIRNLYQTIPDFKEMMNSSDQVFKQVFPTSKSLVEILTENSLESSNAPKGVEWYAILLCYQVSLTNLWIKWGISPKSVMGHCFGEFSAAVVCGALDLKDGFEILKITPNFLQSQVIQPATMIAINCSQPTANKLIQEFLSNNQTGWIDVAVINSDVQTVVIGPPETMTAFQKHCVEQTIKCRTVPGDFCPHSRAVEKACQNSLEILNKVVHHPIQIPYISSLTGELVKDSELNGMFWFKVLRNCVDFKQACVSARDTNVDTFLEIGLDGSLTKFAQANLDDDKSRLNFFATFPRKEYGIHNTLAEMYTLGFPVNWQNFHGSTKRNIVSLPHYPFQRKSFWFERKSQAKIQMNCSKALHPLVGCDVEVPPIFGNFALFRNDNFLCEDLQTSFVKDHCIDNKVIFPGAGFLEMILSSWKLAMKFENISAYSVEKFMIHEPLHLDKSLSLSIITVVNKENGNVCIYTTSGTGSPWRLHATADVILDQTAHQYPVKNIISSAEDNDESEERANEFYFNASKVGLNFGPAFKSLKQIYVNEIGDTVAPIEDMSLFADYFSLHPILIDAMIQGFMVHTKPAMTKLHVPVKINKFVLFEQLSSSANGKLYVHCEKGNNRVVSLVDQNGQLVALMTSLELVATTKEKVLSAAVNQSKGLLDKSEFQNLISLYDVCWKQAKFYQPANAAEFKVELAEKIKDTRKSGKWAVFEVAGGAFSEYKTRMESITNRNFEVFNLNGNLKGEQLQKYVNDCLLGFHGGLEGVLIWMCPPNNVTVVDNCDPISKEILEPLLYITKCLQQSKLKSLPKLHLVSGNCWDLPVPLNLNEMNLQGPSLAQAWGFLKVVRIELPGISSKSIDLEIASKIDDQVSQLVTALWLDDRETEVVYRKGKRFVSRLKEHSVKSQSTEIPNAEFFQVELPKSKGISDIKFSETVNIEELEGSHVKIEVRSVALNFKDVLAVLKPTSEFDNLTSIGLDFSGVVAQVGENVTRVKVGDAVFGLTFKEGCMRSHLITEEKLMVGMPASMTFAEASTLPTVFATAWYCMVNVAGLKKGQTMLLHAASGGVGLAAIQIAKVLGVHVIGTAGNEKKRGFLRRLGVEHVFSSRTTDFKNEITKLTGGQGIDMVLNCLTGPGFKESSLAVCRDGGHFVEISKMDIWSNAQVKDMRPHVNYTIVDLTQVDIFVTGKILEKLSQLLEQGSIGALRYKAYPASSLSQALTYLQKAKQIGKVVINMPINHGGGGRKHCLFNDRSTYLITGGKTGIGFAVCRWMVMEHGAKYIVLVSRSEANENVKQAIADMENNYGAVIKCKELDISDYTQCKLLIEKDLQDLPPLRGVHHCAAVLSDQLLSNQDWPNFERAITAKAYGAWNLHRLTMEAPLEHFVLYSSAVSVFGNIGQTNYACANTYLDNLTVLRTSMGLPALSINWGQWNAGLAENMEISTFKPFSIEEGIQALNYFMRKNDEQENQIVAAKIHFPGVLKLTPHLKNTLLEDIDMSSSSPGQKNSSLDAAPKLESANKVGLITLLKDCTDAEAKENLVKAFVLEMLCETLGTAREEIKDDSEFTDMGMDSIMSIEFTNKMNSALEEDDDRREFSIQLDLEEDGTLNKFTAFLLNALEKV